MKRIGFICTIKNSVDRSKVYVGQTRRSVQNRWKEHLNAAFNSDSDMKIHCVMRDYGVDQFQIEELEAYYFDSLNEREAFWISQYDSFTSGYNSTVGEAGAHQLTDEDASEILTMCSAGSTRDAICLVFGCSPDTVSGVLSSCGISREELMYTHSSYRKVIQINPSTRSIVNRFSSLAEAGCSISRTGEAVLSTCSGVTSSCADYFWKYEMDVSVSDLETGIYTGVLPEMYGRHIPDRQHNREDIVALYKKGLTHEQIIAELGLGSNTVITRALDEAGVSREERRVNRYRKNSKAVVALTDNRRILYEFNSKSEALRFLGITSAQGLIEAVEGNFRYHGCHWQLKSDFLEESRQKFLDILSKGWSDEQILSYAVSLGVQANVISESLFEEMFNTFLADALTIK